MMGCNLYWRDKKYMENVDWNISWKAGTSEDQEGDRSLRSRLCGCEVNGTSSELCLSLEYDISGVYSSGCVLEIYASYSLQKFCS
jgi:hypothetical protein